MVGIGRGKQYAERPTTEYSKYGQAEQSATGRYEGTTNKSFGESEHGEAPPESLEEAATTKPSDRKLYTLPIIKPLIDKETIKNILFEDDDSCTLEDLCRLSS